MTRIILAAILIWLGMPAYALTAYGCRPAQLPQSTVKGSAGVFHVTATGACMTWTCGTTPQLAATTWAGFPVASVAEFIVLTQANSASLLNTLRVKYATTDACTDAALLAAWAPCKADLTAAQIKQLCP